MAEMEAAVLREPDALVDDVLEARVLVRVHLPLRDVQAVVLGVQPPVPNGLRQAPRLRVQVVLRRRLEQAVVRQAAHLRTRLWQEVRRRRLLASG